MVDWKHWHNEPLLIGTLVVMIWTYVLATRVWRFRLAPGEAYSRGHALRFFAALVTFYLAVGSPIDQIGERFLFSIHMIQHMLIMYLVAPLVLTGMPPWLIDTIATRRMIRPVLQRLTAPLNAALIFTVVIGLWHVPTAYDFALRDKLIHVAQHLCFFAISMLVWWPLFSTSRAVPRKSPGVQILHVFALGILQFPVEAYLLFSHHVLYPTYEFAPRLTSMTPREDQVLGGAIMGVGGMFISIGLISWSFYCWHRQDDAHNLSVLHTPPVR